MRGRLRSAVGRTVHLMGFLAMGYGATWFALDANQLGTMWVVNRSVGTTHAPSVRRFITLLSIAAGMTMVVARTRLVRASDVVQLLWAGALMLWSVPLASSLTDAATADRDSRCLHSDCAPDHLQRALLLAPLALGLIAMAIQACLPSAWPRWVRATCAPVLFVVADVVQLVMWQSHVIPLLQRSG